MARPRSTPGTAPSGTREYGRAYYAANRDKLANFAKEAKFRRLLESYGLTVEEFDRLSEQGCVVCGFPHGGLTKDGLEKRLHIDHDHKTGDFRGLLCTRCNTALGLAEDDPDRLIALAMYLERCKIQTQSSTCAP
jgi:Recombination endonuclease VII